MYNAKQGKNILLPLTVWAYDTGTFHMLMCASTLDENLAKAKGRMIDM